MKSPTRERVPWRRALIEGFVIVVSILLAFGIDAAWETSRERAEEAQFLADLRDEFDANRTALRVVIAERESRVILTRILIREAGPDKQGLSSDSLAVLAELSYLNPMFAADRGVLAGGQASGTLSLVSDPDLRSRIAGFWDRFATYFGNEGRAPERWQQTLWTTGSLLNPGVPSWPSMGPAAMWSDPLTSEEVEAVKYLAFRQQMDELLLLQAEPLMAAMDSILVDLAAATSR